MHALVIGVAAYPSAKARNGWEPRLRDVMNIPCAVASARRMADWLFDNKDSLTPQLASIDILLSEAAPDQARADYPMRLAIQQPITEATKDNVRLRGADWNDRFNDGDSAFLFTSGHGAMLGNDAVVFLSDLNADRMDPWGAYLNVSETARAMRLDERLRAAFLFSDACQEFNQRFGQIPTQGGARIIRPMDPMRLGSARDKVAFITAASQGLETLEGVWDGDPEGKVKMGRFTQVLVKALDGASARRMDGDWVVLTEGIVVDLKNLYRLREWTDRFEPSMIYGQNERYSIVAHRSPSLPFIVKTDPAERNPDCIFEIFLPPETSAPAIHRCEKGPRKFWEVWLPASDWTHLLVADHSGVKRALFFTPNQPNFGRTVPFS